MTVKELLSENRDSVISSIKYVYKIWKNEDVKAIMIKFLAYAEKNINADAFNSARNTKTLLKIEVEKMRYNVAPEDRAEWDRKQAEKEANKDKRTSVEMRADWMDKNNLEYNLRKRQYQKI